jgi:ribosomal protein S18 acetylase RimI-like enzyme
MDAAALERHALVAQLTREAQSQDLPRLVALQRRRRFLRLLEERQDEELKTLLGVRGDAAADAITQEVLSRVPDPLPSLRREEAERGVLLHTATLDLERPVEVQVYADCLVMTRIRRMAYTGDSRTVPFHTIAAVEDSPVASTLRRVVLTTGTGKSVLVLPRRDASALLVILERWQDAQESTGRPAQHETAGQDETAEQQRQAGRSGQSGAPGSVQRDLSP